MNKHILVIGSINMDVITNIRKVPVPGESSLGTSLSFIPGGKGANQAVALSRLGADVSFYGKVGKDAFGFEILNHLNEEKLDTSKIFLEEDISTGVALIIVEENGENRIIVIAGANSIRNSNTCNKKNNLKSSSV